MIGRRKTMEDEHGCFQFDTNNGRHTVLLYAVWDGHGGALVSARLKELLPQAICECLSPLKSFTLYNVRTALRDAHKQVHEQLFEEGAKQYDDMGSTSCVVIYIPTANRLFCANVGDSRAVLYIDNTECESTSVTNKCIEISPLSIDHKPDEPFEAERLKELEADVHSTSGEESTMRLWYGTTGLSMSRAFGDFSGVPYITASPDICMYHLRPGQFGFVVVACDGLWDVLNNRDVYNVFAEKQPESGCAAAKLLCRKAFNKGSGDNITVVVFPLAYLPRNAIDSEINNVTFE